MGSYVPMMVLLLVIVRLVALVGRAKRSKVTMDITEVVILDEPRQSVLL